MQINVGKMNISLKDNEPDILYSALQYYLKELVSDVEASPDGGWPEINEEIAIVESLKERLRGIIQ